MDFITATYQSISAAFRWSRVTLSEVCGVWRLSPLVVYIKQSDSKYPQSSFCTAGTVRPILPDLEIKLGSIATAFLAPVCSFSDRLRLNESQSKSLVKFRRKRCSHELLYLPNRRKLFFLGMTIYKTNVSMRNILERLVSFTHFHLEFRYRYTYIG